MADEKTPKTGTEDETPAVEDGKTPETEIESGSGEDTPPVEESGTSAAEATPDHEDEPTPDPDAQGASEVEAEPDAADDTSPEEAEREEEATAFTEGQAEMPEAADGTDTADQPDKAAENAEPAPAPVPVVQEKVVERRGGFFPMLLGGLVAAAAGFAASAYTNQTWPFGAGADDGQAEMQSQLDAQSGELADLLAKLDETDATVAGIDLSGLESSVTDIQSRLDTASGEFEQLSGRLGDLGTRLTALEKRPVVEAVSPEAIAAYERELEEVRKAIETQRTEVEQMTQQALEAEANAEEQAGMAKARAALAEVVSALQSGEPYNDALVTVAASADVPDALSGPAPDGVPTLATLIEEYPPLARDALKAARREGTAEAEGSGRFATFLANQLGARSVTPRDGDSPDAVLSRAESTLRDGDLQATLDELSTLPDTAKAVLADWMAKAQTRADALAAADAVGQELNKE